MSVPTKVLPELSLRRITTGCYYHVSADGRWWFSGAAAAGDGTHPPGIPLCSIADCDLLRSLITYGLGYQCLGFFEMVQDAESKRVLGTRACEYPSSCGFGAQSERHEIWTAAVTLQSGARTVVIKASHSKPVTVLITTSVLCGRYTGDTLPEGMEKASTTPMQ